MSQSRRSPRRSPRRSSRGHRRRRSRARSNEGEDEKTTSPRPSPGSWNVDRGRSRVRRPSNPFSEESLRRRCVVHSLFTMGLLMKAGTGDITHLRPLSEKSSMSRSGGNWSGKWALGRTASLCGCSLPFFLTIIPFMGGFGTNS